MRRYEGSGYFKLMVQHASSLAEILDDYAHDTTKMTRKALEHYTGQARVTCIDMAMLKLEVKLGKIKITHKIISNKIYKRSMMMPPVWQQTNCSTESQAFETDISKQKSLQRLAS